MKPLNYKEIKKQKKRFFFIFFTTLVVIFCSSYFTIITAKKGVDILEKKYAMYNKIFEKQATITFDLDEIIKKLYQLKSGKRSLSEHKHFQILISDLRDNMEKTIRTSKNETKEFAIYKELLVEIKTIQSTIDQFSVDEEEYLEDKVLYERCIEKYNDINKNY